MPVCTLHPRPCHATGQANAMPSIYQAWHLLSRGQANACLAPGLAVLATWARLRKHGVPCGCQPWSRSAAATFEPPRCRRSARTRCRTAASTWGAVPVGAWQPSALSGTSPSQGSWCSNAQWRRVPDGRVVGRVDELAAWPAEGAPLDTDPVLGQGGAAGDAPARPSRRRGGQQRLRAGVAVGNPEVGPAPAGAWRWGWGWGEGKAGVALADCVVHRREVSADVEGSG